MGFAELFLIGVSLAMDAFAVAVCKGLNMKKLDIKQTALIALFFGGFQAVMPLIGWAVGVRFSKYITSVDHWITFILLSFIGGKMIIESFKGEEDTADDKFNIKELIILSLATSIDALAVGITFAFLMVNIFESILIIGLITFVLSALGVIIGNKFGSAYQNKAELAGGIILVLIGVKILLEHLNIIG